MNSTTISQKLLSPTQAALLTGYSASHIRRLVREGKIKAYKPVSPRGGRNTHIKININDLDAAFDGVLGVHQ